MSGRLTRLMRIGVMCMLVNLVAMQTGVLAQGRGRGGGAGHAGPGMGNPGGGRPGGLGVDRGIATSSEMSGGRADAGRMTASERSEGRYDAGLDRARLRRENARRAEDELHDHPEMPAKLNTTANDLRDGYRRALLGNPELKFGEYVAASRLAANLRGRHSNVTREAILAGLARGSSIGRTLQDLGLNKSEAREAKNSVEREVKASKRR